MDSADAPLAGEVTPCNGPSRYSFTFAELTETTLPDWPPDFMNRHIWNAAKAEIARHWENVRVKKIWSPYPILSYCMGTAEAPIPYEQLSPIEQMVRDQSSDQNKQPKVVVRYFLFSTKTPQEQSQAIAQVICKSEPAAEPGNVEMWVDALRENELETEHHRDMKNALAQLKSSATSTKTSQNQNVAPKDKTDTLSTNYCPKCNTSYEFDKKFCGKCGVPLAAGSALPALAPQVAPSPFSSPPLSTPPSSASRGMGWVIVAVVIAVAGYFAYDSFKAKNNTSATTSPSSQQATINKEVVLRSGPGIMTQALGKLAPATRVVVTGSATDPKGNIWNKIRIESGPLQGKTGYIKPAYLDGGAGDQAGAVAGKAETSSPRLASKPVAIPPGVIHKGQVLEVLNAGGYSYVEVEENGRKLWVAVLETKVTRGDLVEFSDSPPMINFNSRSLNRTFDKIIFAPGLRIKTSNDSAFTPPKPSIPAVPNASNTETIINRTMKQSDKWRAEISVWCLESNTACGKIDFRSLRCGGDLIYAEKQSEGYLFRENLNYGKCLPGCNLLINSNGTSYKEICNGNITDTGMLN